MPIGHQQSLAAKLRLLRMYICTSEKLHFAPGTQGHEGQRVLPDTQTAQINIQKLKINCLLNSAGISEETRRHSALLSLFSYIVQIISPSSAL